MNSFKHRYTFEKRVEEFNRIKLKYPDRIAVIAEKFSGDKFLPSFSKTKYILPDNTTVGQMLYTIRCSLGFHIKPTTALFLFINNTLPPSNMKLKELYNIYVDPDGFIYAVISSENAFG